MVYNRRTALFELLLLSFLSTGGTKMDKESVYQGRLIKKLKLMFPGCHILKNDPNYTQGIPDLIVLYEDRWAMLEVKASCDSPQQPNQDYYIDRLGEMSYSAYIYPENEEEVLRDLQLTFGLSGAPRIS